MVTLRYKWNAGVLYLCCSVENRARYPLGFAAATCHIEPKLNNERGRFMAAVTLPTHYRNVFAELGYAQAEIDARIENVQMMENGNRTTDSTKAPPAPKAQCFPVQGVLWFSSAGQPKPSIFDRDFGDDRHLFGLVPGFRAVSGLVGNGVQHIKTALHFAKGGVTAVQLGSILVNNKELRAGGIKVIIARHRKGTADMLERVVDAIFRKLALNMPITVRHDVIVRRTALNDIILNDAAPTQTI